MIVYNCRTMRCVEDSISDKIITDEQLLSQLNTLLQALSIRFPPSWSGLPEPSLMIHQESLQVHKRLMFFNTKYISLMWLFKNFVLHVQGKIYFPL